MTEQPQVRFMTDEDVRRLADEGVTAWLMDSHAAMGHQSRVRCRIAIAFYNAGRWVSSLGDRIGCMHR